MIQLKRAFFLLWSVVAAVFCTAGLSHAQSTSEERPLSEIISDIQSETGFRFLYREALVSGIQLTFNSSQKQLFESLGNELRRYDLSIRVDSTHRQAIIVKQEPKTGDKSQSIVKISGQAVDAATGERLPFATITWDQSGEINGVSANSSGSFQMELPAGRSQIQLNCSFLGYMTETIELDLTAGETLQEITFRLETQLIDGNELVVTGMNYYGQVNENSSGLVDIGTFSPLGSSNSIRGLQSLPSTSLSPALSGDMHVRGSPADGFQVLLDGITVFNQSHLFGLLDSFNADVLHRSGFFYDITPAQYQAPPGGTLSMVTQTGSLNDISATIGASNTSYRLTLEGPLEQGKSSWLLSGRSSYLNSVDWMNNSNLIQWGLNVKRPREILEEDMVNLETQLVRPGDTDAHFYDLHGKLYFENQDGSRFIASGYYGGDYTEQDAQRLYRTFQSSSENIEFRDVSSRNKWDNGAISLQYQNRWSENIYAHSTLAGSVYQTEFLKEDFSYTRINYDNNSFQLFTFPFENKSILNELKAEQQIDINSDPWLWTTGISYQYYLGEYYEDSFDRPGFLTTRRSHKTDIYAQLNYTGLDRIDLSAGNRLHYYSNGEYLRWSPRFKIRLFPNAPVSVGGGFSRNFQFLNKISLSNTVTSDVWVLANSDHPPTEVNYFSAGLYLESASWLYVQLEGYHKEFKHIRLHEINAISLTNTFNSAPWFTNNNGLGRGVELLVNNQLGKINLSQTFAVSSIELSNPAINEGEPFYADWDRRFRYGVTLDTEPVSNIFLYLSWMYATGTPNRLATFGAANDDRLDPYQRTDVTIEYKSNVSFGKVNASLSLFNLFGRQNSWYRDLAFVLDQNDSGNRFRSVPVDVYDIGFQPSFNLSVGL